MNIFDNWWSVIVGEIIYNVFDVVEVVTMSLLFEMMVVVEVMLILVSHFSDDKVFVLQVSQVGIEVIVHSVHLSIVLQNQVSTVYWFLFWKVKESLVNHYHFLFYLADGT